MTRARASLALAVVGSLVAAGCSLLPPTIECGPLDPAECQQRAQAIVAEGQRGDPTRRLVRLTFTYRQGSYSAEFDDGTGRSLIVD